MRKLDKNLKMIFSNSEFFMVFITYLIILVGLICGLTFSVKYKNRFKNNLLFFIFYTAVLFKPAANAENWKGGSSLYFIVFGWIFLLVHLVIFIALTLRKYFVEKVQKPLP